MMLPKVIRKRDGTQALFEPGKVERAVYRACLSDPKRAQQAVAVARQVTAGVTAALSRRTGGGVPGIEQVQDLVEEQLIARGHADEARRYIVHRKEHQDLRRAKASLGIADELKLPLSALLVLKERYLLKDAGGRVRESTAQLFERVADAVSRAELDYRSKAEQPRMREQFYRMMATRRFMPNSPTLMNAGTRLGQLSACFVLPIEDSLESIFDTVKHTAMIHRTGGGTGFDFSSLRARGEQVTTTRGASSGPISFISIFNQTTDVIMRGGKRRGANMAVLRCDHPDVFEFVEAKLQDGALGNFNLSVAVTDRFMRAVRRDIKFDLVSPRGGRTVRTIKARALFDLIAFAAWRNGEPGLLYIDEINRHNPTPSLGRIAATNPCSEVLLLPYESCNLGSVNLASVVRGGTVRWKQLEEAVRLGVRFLDNVISVTRFPLPEIEAATLGNRKIGLGVMGFADMLIKLGIPYSSPEAVATARKVMRFVQRCSLAASCELARERGAFPNCKRSVLRGPARRNATINALAPTGTISMIAGCSSGIEPLYSLSLTRTILDGTRIFEMNRLFEETLQQHGVCSQDIIAEVRATGTAQDVRPLPAGLRRLFATAHDVAPEQHLAVQAAFQKYTDNAVSKTVNLPADASVDDVRRLLLAAHASRCKGVTVYRDGSREGQVLTHAVGGPPAEQPEDGCFSGICTF